jgi:hypothetical protein
MKFDQSTLQFLILLILFGQIFAVRMVKGTARETTEGLSFGMKWPATLLRIVLLPLFFARFGYLAWVTHHTIPAWTLGLCVALAAVILFQMPGTIVLTPTAIVQHFWLRPSKTIQYNEVMALEQLQGGRITRVLGDNRVRITHTWGHSASEQFQQEIARRRSASKAHIS